MNLGRRRPALFIFVHGLLEKHVGYDRMAMRELVRSCNVARSNEKREMHGSHEFRRDMLRSPPFAPYALFCTLLSLEDLALTFLLFNLADFGTPSTRCDYCRCARPLRSATKRASIIGTSNLRTSSSPTAGRTTSTLIAISCLTNSSLPVDVSSSSSRTLD